MKFICSKCCDDDNEKPCKLKIPNAIKMNREDYLVGLNTCPFENTTLKNGAWKTTGKHTEANWVRKK